MVCCFACPYSASSHPELNFTTRTETCLLSSWFYLAWVTHFTTFECPCLVVFFSFLNLRIHIKFRYIFQDICLANSAELWENPLWCVWAQFFFTQSLIHIRQLKSKRTSFYLQNSKDESHSKFDRELDKRVENLKIKNLRCGFDGRLFPRVAKN